MKLGIKIVLPILLLLVIVLGVFGYIFYSLKQQETIISSESIKIRKLNGLNERLVRQQEQTDYNVLGYRFNQDRTFLLTISQASLDKAKTLDEMYPFITSTQGRELMIKYIDARKEVESLRRDLIDAIDEGNQAQINLSYNKWSIQTQNIKAAFADIKAYNINSLEKTLDSVEAVRNRITQVIILLVLVVIATVILLYFYFRVVIVAPIIKLASMANQLAKADFTAATTTTTTTTGINSNDEIGALASSFNTMSVKLKEYYAELEGKVKAKTEELSHKVLDLENTKKATLNLFEDLEGVSKDLEKFKLAVDNTSEMVIITDPEGTVLYGNKAVEKITGYKSEEAIGNKSGTLWKSPMPAEYYQTLWDTIKSQKKTFIGEIQNKRKNGEVYTAVISITPILNKKGEIEFFVGIERDITKEKNIDKAKTEFVSLASHQLRTPLSAINWNLELLMSDNKAKLDSDQKEYASEAYAASKRMVGLVSALLNVSRIEMDTFMVKLALTNIVEVIKSCIKEFEHKILEKKLTLTQEYDPSLPKIMVDDKILGIVCQNLLENAVNYTQEGGKIKVLLTKKESDVIITIADNGIGIPKIQQPQIFTKMFRADNAREKEVDGTGLGLYMTKAIVEHSGGKIWFESQEGKGSTFYVEIPLSGMQAKDGKTVELI